MLRSLAASLVVYPNFQKGLLSRQYSIFCTMSCVLTQPVNPRSTVHVTEVNRSVRRISPARDDTETIHKITEVG
jgi:hypothetical protein